MEEKIVTIENLSHFKNKIIEYIDNKLDDIDEVLNDINGEII
jgi:hypothetical protein